MTLIIVGSQAHGHLRAQSPPTPFAAYFEEAYETYPSIPKGVLEAVAWTNTRIRHLDATPSCQGLPQYHGVMGLVEDGKGYFQNSLSTVARLSGYSAAEIKADPRTNILAFAAAYAQLQNNKRLANNRVESHRPILADLTELPVDGDPTSQYALDQQFYMVLQEMERPHTSSNQRLPRRFDYEAIFGQDNYRVLSANRVTVSRQRIASPGGNEYTAPGARTASCTASGGAVNFGGAVWTPAHSNNYGSRDGADVKYVTIHTVQGSYASAIAWFRNARARVSAHYIIRASDGQVTQMVCEEDKAYHVRTDNSEAIGIEHEGFIDDGGAWYTNELYESSAALVRDLCARHNINPLQMYGGPPTDGILTLTNTCYRIKGHQHFRGNTHIDPGPFWDWDRFYRLVNPTPEPSLFTQTRGTLTDPGGSNGNYPDQHRATYLIRPEGATSIELDFQELDLEGTPAKPYDYLDIYDGPDMNGRFLGRFTGNQVPDKLIAQSGAVFIEFRSDCQVNEAGWRIKYKAYGRTEDCPAPTDLLASNLFAMGTTLTWQGEASRYVVLVRRRSEGQLWTRYLVSEPRLTLTGLKSNSIYQWQVRAVCGADSSAWTGASFVTPNLMGRGNSPQLFTIRLNEGRFNDSGGRESGYTNDENFAYRILAPNGGRIRITFDAFETEADHDFLTIYDGNSFSDRKIGEYHGDNSPGQILASGPELLLHFRSDGATMAPGWQASWTTIGGTQPPVDPDPQPPQPDPNTDPRPDPDPQPPVTPVVRGDFALDMDYPRYAPTTAPELPANLAGSFTLRFADRDRTGRGFANRFYNLAERRGGSWKSRPQAGFLFADFDQGMGSEWTAKSGSWAVANGVLVQGDASAGNSNLYTDLRQTGDHVYVYHWQARMSGEDGNLRHGLHFFASHPDQEDRGTSYFVWIRENGSRDQVEIYKTINNVFERKASRNIDWNPDRVYDIKTIYNPQKGRIEVYVNNDFSGAWVDPSPIRSGRGISIRSGGCVLELDNLIVYQDREATVTVAVGGENAPLTGDREFLVNSLVVDRRIQWSKIGQQTGTFGAAPAPPAPDPTPSPAPEPTPTPEPPAPGATTVSSLPSVIDGPLRWQAPAGTYYLPAAFDGREWAANPSAGFAYDDFSRIRPQWTTITGSWESRFGTMQQTNPIESNSNVYLSVQQAAGTTFLYRFRARLLTEGENKRFGMHFLVSSPGASNRGNSYLVWFRYSENGPDKVELYRAEGNAMPVINESAIVTIQPLSWYEITVLADPATNEISVWMGSVPVLSWTDPNGLHAGGQAVSFRTGNAQVQFDDLRIFQAVPGGGAPLPVSGDGAVFPFRSQGNSPAARLIWLSRSGRAWAAEEEAQAVVR